MTELSAPWPETSTPQIGDGRAYTAAEWDQIWEALYTAMGGATQGILPRVWNTLAVTAPAANTIRCNTGMAFVKGHFYQNDASLDLTPASAGAGTTRKDSVVLRCIWTSTGQYTVRLATKEGTAGAYPAMTQTDDATWELELYRYTIDDTGAITALTDVRTYCHFATMVDEDMLDASVAGDGLDGGVGTPLSVAASEIAGAHLSGAGHTLSVTDGAGSGLDADLLDGSHAAAFAAASHNHAGTAITSGKIANTYLNTGTGNGLDADLLDGNHAADIIAGGMILGGIIMWSGTLGGTGTHCPMVGGVADEKWHICNGDTVNGLVTPDLRDRFIVGAGSAYAKGATGGNATNNLTHNHSATGLSVPSSGAHLHTAADSTFAASGSDTAVGNTTDGAHTHSTLNGTTANQTGQTAVENRPPYYGLYFIMKVA